MLSNRLLRSRRVDTILLTGRRIQFERLMRSHLKRNAAENGFHAQHAGVMATITQEFGVVGGLIGLIGGAIHETPVDWDSFWQEQTQGTVNHILDSFGDGFANQLGFVVGAFDPSDNAVQHAIDLGNEIPGPAEGRGYVGNPSDAWGPY